MDPTSFRGRPLGRLSLWAGLPVGVATDPPAVGEGPLSEESRIFSSDDILMEEKERTKLFLFHQCWRCSYGLNIQHYRTMFILFPFTLLARSPGSSHFCRSNMKAASEPGFNPGNWFNCHLNAAVQHEGTLTTALSFSSSACLIHFP